ncbi:MAG: hypothetical protein HKN75_01515 [Bacteroidia bacterium]|nr:hypothetical protein [Bacteroidia bacterium]
MELDQLTDIWKNTDKESEKLEINKSLFKEVGMSKIKSNLMEYRLENTIELIVNSLFIIFLVYFMVNHFTVAKFFVPALLLWISAVASIVLSGYKIYWFQSIDAKNSIIKTQKAIERIKFFDRLDTNTLMIVIPVFSLAILIVLAKGLLGIDLYAIGNWMVHYFFGSMIVGIIITVLLRLFPDKNLKKASDFLKEIKSLDTNENK